MAKQCGFTMIEVLLCIVILAIILTLGLYHEQRAAENARVAQVNSDLLVIRRALDDYYHKTGCCSGAAVSGVCFSTTALPYGTFSGTIYNPSSPATTWLTMSTLGLTSYYNNRPPIILDYKAGVQDSGVKTQNGRPVYNLVVLAQLGSNYTASRQSWYQQQFNAKQILTINAKPYLFWSSLSAVSLVQPGDPYWVLGGQQKYFRQNQTLSSSTSGIPDPSANYCAN